MKLRPCADHFHARFIIPGLCILLFALIAPQIAQAIELCGSGDYIDINSGDFYIWNNHDETTAGPQCIEANYDGSFTVTRNDYGQGGGSYPINFKGCHWSWCTPDSGMPARIDTIISAPFNWSFSGTNAGGTWNCSFEGWVKKNSTPGAPDAVEIMIWPNYHGGAMPAGSIIATVTIDGSTWNLWKSVFANWTYTAYMRTSTTNNLNIDVKHFINDLVSRGICQDQWYLEAMESGFELYNTDGIGLTSESFSASVTVTNPPEISIVSPQNGDNFTAGSNITIDVNTSDSDGNIVNVEFYRSSVKIGESNTPPYSYTWTNVPPGYYTLTAKATDNYGAKTTSSAIIIEVIGGTGMILREWWTGIPGDSITDLTSDPNYPNQPTGRAPYAQLEGPTNWANDYGTRFRGFLHPGADTNYTFWIASDANSQLWLSPDDNSVNASIIASVSGRTSPREWTKYPEQQSSPVSMTGGGKYYIEVLHKATDGNDNVSVAWASELDPNVKVIDGNYLSPCCLNLKDFSNFATRWRLTNCHSGNRWCDGSDYNHDGSVLLNDLKLFTESWLDGL